MTDFAAAFRQGQQAAQQAVTDKAEIDEVFGLLSRQLSDATDGKIVIFVDEINSLASGLVNMAIAANALASGREGRLMKERWICARNLNAQDTSEERLAKWERPYEGYPCTLTFGNRDIRCHDREGLERGLAEMLQDAWVGEKLLKLISRPLKQALENPESAAPSDQSTDDSAPKTD
jgi:hypothetical protein